MPKYGVYLEQWCGFQRPRIGWWRQHGPAYFEIPGPKVPEFQRRILKTIGLPDEEVDGVRYRWQVRPHPEAIEVFEEPAFARQAGGAP